MGFQVGDRVKIAPDAILFGYGPMLAEEELAVLTGMVCDPDTSNGPGGYVEVRLDAAAPGRMAYAWVKPTDLTFHAEAPFAEALRRMPELCGRAVELIGGGLSIADPVDLLAFVEEMGR